MTDIEKNGNITELEAQDLAEVSGGKGNGGNIVKATGNVNVRKGPGKDYGIIASVPSGTMMSYLGSTKKDSRGVAWYKINYNGSVAWISSKYSKRC